MSTATIASIAPETIYEDSRVVAPVSLENEWTAEPCWETETTTETAVDSDVESSLKTRLRIDPAVKERTFWLEDLVQLALLLVFGAAAVSLPAIMFMKLFSELAQFSSMDFVRMLAGMP